MSARSALRSATAKNHVMVDAAFGRFDLADRGSYGSFLTAHARALPAVEKALEHVPALPAFGVRADLLRQDLNQLGLPMPAPLPFPVPLSQAAGFGALYVSEGSRLGGAMLARQVHPELPHTYLSATHEAGDWRAFGRLLDSAALAGGRSWLDDAIRSARATFDLYAEAASTA
ncbi:biliverdin-producing heme oxygenase [Sphingomonas crusticola]|uniref:biliverdin-producing heme oxygenase n=1 Tax=Sphingomonas crusticola TaxID=1697973 RepID=UPI000E2584FE|nr:biliverdin-producing heme oxygenase [Sphingomonas crusticola]